MAWTRRVVEKRSRRIDNSLKNQKSVSVTYSLLRPCSILLNLETEICIGTADSKTIYEVQEILQRLRGPSASIEGNDHAMEFITTDSRVAKRSDEL
jgi:hypothetical protein